MNQDQPELTLDESVKQVMQTLPPVIRTYLSQGKYTEVVKSLMTKYNLRIDQGGVLEREIILLLMGIENPDEFTQSLAEEAKLDRNTIEGIVQDVNTQIFVPLREGMRSGAAAMPQVSKPTMPQNHPQNSMSPSAFPQGRPVSGFPQGNTFRPAQPLRPTVSNTVPVRSASMPLSRPMSGSNFLEDHEEPHIEFNKSLVPGLPKWSPPPINLPGAVMPTGVIPPGGRPSFAMPQMPATPVPTAALRPAFLPPLVPVQKTPLPPAPKSYSSDPYREPLD